MSEKLVLYKVSESRWRKTKEEMPAEAYVAAISMAAALQIFVNHFGEVLDATVTRESTDFLMAD